MWLDRLAKIKRPEPLPEASCHLVRSLTNPSANTHFLNHMLCLSVEDLILDYTGWWKRCCFQLGLEPENQWPQQDHGANIDHMSVEYRRYFSAPAVEPRGNYPCDHRSWVRPDARGDIAQGQMHKIVGKPHAGWIEEEGWIPDVVVLSSHRSFEDFLCCHYLKANE